MSDVSVAVADAPSTSGAHWANRDNENIYRRTGTPYRRPNAVNSFPDGEEPDEQETEPASWWGADDGAVPPESDFPAAPAPAPAASEQSELPRRQFAPQPEFGPAPPASGSRASFGVSAGPIGGFRPGYGPGPAGPEGHDPAHGAPADDEPEPSYSGGLNLGPAPTSPAPRSRPVVPPVTGHTGEIFMGRGREIRPHRAVKQNTGGHAALKMPTPPGGTPTTAPAPAPASAPPPAKRSRRVTVAAFALGSVVLLAAVAGGTAYFSGGDKNLSKVLELGSATGNDRTVTAPLDGRTTAGFEMLAASNQVTVKTQDLGDNLYKITTADDSGMLPSPAISADRVQLHLTPQDKGGNGDVTVLLSSKVLWSLRFTGGSDEQLIDLTGGKISEVNLIGGARRVELTLPKPIGTVPVHVTAGLDELSVNSTANAPVRVNVQAGAKTVAAGTRTLRDVAPGSTLTPKNWQVKDRYDVDAKSWVTLLSVDAKN